MYELGLSAAVINSLIEKEEFTHYSQGLYSTDDWTRIGEEMLLRSEMGSPETIFQEAKQAMRLYDLETKAIFKVVKTFHEQKKISEALLFINIYPSTILNSEFPSYINRLSSQFPVNKKGIVFEIIETEMVGYNLITLFKERIHLLKKLGYLIAMDDVGKGWSTLNLMIEIEPHYIKLDQYFSVNLSKTPLKQSMIKSLLDYAKKSNLKVVLEGVEKGTDLAIAKALGVHICQGFLLDRPKPAVLYA